MRFIITVILLFLSSLAFATTEISTCFSPEYACDLKLISFMKTASKTLDVAIYSITHEDIANEIIAAKKRGVKVRVVVDLSQSQGQYSLTPTLIAAKVPLRIGEQEGIMHQKFTIVDKAALETGSFNYTNSATFKNAENQIYLNDPTTVKSYLTEFNKIWESGSLP